ncbi:MAG: Lrp/AsnC family transcriptional regulator [Aquisalinus sp.]|nr:Lrp/AsnC family transcriptional regulator [Aquisalinus sp.]
MAEIIDDLDRKILQLLQVDSTIGVVELGEKIGLSHNACWRRIRRLQKMGIIASQVALLDRKKVELSVTVFVFVRTSQHDDKWLERFSHGISEMPEVVEFHRLSGELDYILKLHVQDIEDYDRVYKQLIRIAPLSDVSSSFSMEEIKYTTALPV